MKKLLVLGGNAFQTSVIAAAKELGCYVITCDYLPNNPGHVFADEYHNVSTTDKEAVLDLASRLGVDGVLSYASDVSQPTVAYVADKLGLPGNPQSAIETLTQKDLFRTFLRRNNLASPQSGSFSCVGVARQFAEVLRFPIVLKPADSSGSKGLTKLTSLDDAFDKAFSLAFENSPKGVVIVEEYISSVGYQLEAEGFVLDGKIVFYAPLDQHHDLSCAPYVPIGTSSHSASVDAHAKAAKLLQDIFDAVGYRFGSFNFEFLVNSDGEPFPLEIGPRNGGNLIPDVVEHAYGINLARYLVQSSLGSPVEVCKPLSPGICTTSYLIHSLEDGMLESIHIDPSIERRIVKRVEIISPGEPVRRFRDARDGIACIMLDFGNDASGMKQAMDSMNDLIKVSIE